MNSFIENLKNFKAPTSFIQKQTSIVDNRVQITLQEIHSFCFRGKIANKKKNPSELKICDFTDSNSGDKFKTHIRDTIIPSLTARIWDISFESATAQMAELSNEKFLDHIPNAVFNSDFFDSVTNRENGSFNFEVVIFVEITGPEYALLESFFDYDNNKVTDSEGIKVIIGAEIFKDNPDDPLSPIRYEE